MSKDNLIAEIKEYYAKSGNEAGGSLHLVLDDENLDYESVRFCLDYAIGEDDFDGAMLALKLLKLTKEEREEMVDVLSQSIEDATDILLSYV